MKLFNVILFVSLGSVSFADQIRLNPMDTHRYLGSSVHKDGGSYCVTGKEVVRKLPKPIIIFQLVRSDHKDAWGGAVRYQELGFEAQMVVANFEKVLENPVPHPQRNEEFCRSGYVSSILVGGQVAIRKSGLSFEDWNQVPVLYAEYANGSFVYRGTAKLKEVSDSGTTAFSFGELIEGLDLLSATSTSRSFTLSIEDGIRRPNIDRYSGGAFYRLMHDYYVNELSLTKYPESGMQVGYKVSRVPR